MEICDYLNKCNKNICFRKKVVVIIIININKNKKNSNKYGIRVFVT